MQYLIFLYSLASAMCLFINCLVFFMNYLKKRSKTLLTISIAFFFFFLEDIFFYMTEFITDFSLYFTSYIHYEPMIKTLLIIAILASYRMIIYYGLDTGFSKLEKFFCGINIVILAVLPALTLTPLTNLLYNTLTWGYTFYVLILGIVFTKRSEYSDKENASIRLFLIICLVLQVIAFGETIYWIVTDKFLLQSLWPSYGQRRFGLETITQLYNIVGIIYIFKYFIPSIKQVSDELEDERKLQMFIDKFALTPREGEVLELVAKRYTNQEICDELHISIGTVKTHIHNIFVKADVAKRTEVLSLIMKQSI